STWGLDIRWWSERPELAFHVGVGVNRADGVQLFSFLSLRSDLPAMRGRENYRLRLEVPSLPVVRGELDLYVFLADEAGLHVYDQAHLPNALVVDSDDYDYGVIAVDHRWELVPEVSPADEATRDLADSRADGPLDELEPVAIPAAAD
ncbi:MAG: hypothetical protein MI919_21885, partial [Holophagales bacterium]|nr:hypothetical protein [Holophagales bacterium]